MKETRVILKGESDKKITRRRKKGKRYVSTQSDMIICCTLQTLLKEENNIWIYIHLVIHRPLTQ